MLWLKFSKTRRKGNEMDRNERIVASQEALRAAERRGEVADSTDVRAALLKRVKSGEITLPECQAELERIKRGAKRAGQLTRSQAYAGKRLPKGE